MKVTVFFDDNYRVGGTKEQREAAASELWHLAQRRNMGRTQEEPARVLTPDAVVDEASDSQNPLHPMFEWDDAVAAHEHRKEQARQMIRGLRVQYEETGPPIRLVNTVRVREDDVERGYVRVDQAMTYEPDREFVLRQAISGIRSWRERYQGLSEFAELFAAIDKFDFENMEDLVAV